MRADEALFRVSAALIGFNNVLFPKGTLQIVGRVGSSLRSFLLGVVGRVERVGI